MKTLFLFLLLALAISTARAYPIDPRPLRKLVIESDYIVVGHVLEIKERKRKDKNDFGPTAIAVIRVIECLQGKITASVIEVPYPANFICPAPPRYEPDTDVIVFLTKNSGSFRTHALSYGVKTLALSQIEVYKARILEMQQILKITDGDQQFLESVEWLVKCAENEVTRWEGTYELSPSSDFMSYYAQSELPPFKQMLSADQKLRLKTALLNRSAFGYHDFGLVDLLYAENEEEIYRVLVDGLKNIQDNQLWMADSYMERIILRKSSAVLEDLCKAFSKKQFENNKVKELRNIVDQFISHLDK